MQQLAQQRNGYCQQTPKTGIAEADLPVKVEFHVGIIPYGTTEPNVDDPPEQKFDCRYQNCACTTFCGKRHGTQNKQRVQQHKTNAAGRCH